MSTEKVTATQPKDPVETVEVKEVTTRGSSSQWKKETWLWDVRVEDAVAAGPAGVISEMLKAAGEEGLEKLRLLPEFGI